MCQVWWTRFSTKGRLSWENKLCSSTYWPISSSFETAFIAKLIQKKKHRIARSFNLSFRHIDDVLSLNNPSFGDLIHRMYPKEPEMKDITDTVKSVSYLDLHLDIDDKEKLLTKLYDKRNDF